MAAVTCAGGSPAPCRERAKAGLMDPHRLRGALRRGGRLLARAGQRTSNRELTERAEVWMQKPSWTCRNLTQPSMCALSVARVS